MHPTFGTKSQRHLNPMKVCLLRISDIVVCSARNFYVVLQEDQVTVNQRECVIVVLSYKHYQGNPASWVISSIADAGFCRVKYMRIY